MSVVDIFIILLLLTASALCIALMFGLKRIVQSVSMLQRDVNDLTTSLKPLIESTQSLTNKVIVVTEETKNQLHVSKSIINDVRLRVDQLLEFEGKVKDGFENSVMPLINNLSAIVKGFDAFWKKYKNN